jgi:transcriptional regulator with GAF, ATPase, and Fis domain
MAIVSVCKSDSKAEIFRRAIFKRVTTLGSAPDCDVVLEDGEVAPLHAMIVLEGTNFHVARGPDVRHLVVSGHKKKKAVLEHQTTINIGPYEIRFDLFDEPQPTQEESGDTLMDAYRRLHRFSLRIADSEKVEDLLERLLNDVMELAEAEKGFIFLVAGDKIEKIVARNLRPTDMADLEKDAWSDTIVQQAVEQRKPMIISDAMSDENFHEARSVVNLRLASVLCVPLIHRDQVLGVLYLGNRNVVNLFTAETLSVVTIFAAQSALLIHAALALQEIKADRDRLKDRLEQRSFGSMIGASECMQTIFRTIDRVASTNLPVLVEGETGTGKELVARELHDRGTRKRKAFVAVNCGAIPENLLESELFGHMRGAFTGATHNHRGLFERAHEGTLFLDEVGELPVQLQVKLLRVLQDQVVRPIGGQRDIPVQVRIVAATNRDIEACVADGSFREDLYYRLNGVRLSLPPLRARDADVVLIARYLMNQHRDELNPSVRDFNAPSMQAMLSYDWPGNIRELDNKIRKALVMTSGIELTPEDLGLTGEAQDPILPLSEAKERFARRYVEKMLSLNNGNRAKTAKELEVDPRTIYRYLQADRDGE